MRTIVLVFFDMYFFVAGKISRIFERESTNFTFKRFFSTVYTDMFDQVSFSLKFFVTMIAFKGSFPGMRAIVGY